ncbi:MAG: CDP-alcohol phosphatidyltransferase family protein [Syntrophales bacterium]|jgi:CDP-diacylglycerol--glycerol-3-phosphate 3-phosphatidyltransferase|nr:CDP-alcohol phosphatidyltransferase family protein [Syntrophales bacterium]MDY0045495.1 CDP-alcohol phosphatidyltransferase family protein [Syntrophales bacterium]
MTFIFARQWIIRNYYSVVGRLIRPLAKASVSANVISVCSLLLSCGAFLLYAGGLFFTGGLVLLLAGFADTLDGTVARFSGKTSKFGALLDSSLDRWSDFLVFAGLLLYYRDSPVFYAVLFSIIGSFMVSYIKARAESLGNIRVVGIMQRPERILLLAFASLLSPLVNMIAPAYAEAPVIAVVWIMAVLTNGTSVHRLFAAKRDLLHQ